MREWATEFLLGGGLVWVGFSTVLIFQIKQEVSHLKKTLSFIDWEKVPKKNLNDVFNRE